MKNILFIMKALYAGGAEKQYRLILDSLDGDYKFHVLLLNHVDDETQTNQFIEEHPKISFYKLNGKELVVDCKTKNSVRREKIVNLIKQFRWIKTFLRTVKIDAVMYSYVTQLLMTPLFLRKGIRVIFNERNTGHQLCDNFLKRKLIASCSKVVANSIEAAEWINRYTGKDVFVLNNGIIIDELIKQKNDTFTILVPARLSYIKNQKLVIDALLKMNDRTNIEVILAGAINDTVYYEEIKQIIEQNKLNVKIFGYCENVKELYQRTDLVILPSYEEGTPNVLLEAYMYRIPALASDIKMNRRCCIDSNMLFNPDDSKQLAEKIELFREDKLVADIENIKKQSYKFVLNNYGIEQMKKNYYSMFKEITS